VNLLGKSIMVTSLKGGVGKSTVAVNLGVGFAVKKYKTLIIDLDVSSGSVDLFIGCEGDAVYNLFDVLEARVNIKDAVYSKKMPDYEIDILKSPPSYDLKDLESLQEKIAQFTEAAKKIYDFVIFDCPSGKFEIFDYIAGNSDLIFAVTMHSVASVRSAEKLALHLSGLGVKSENVRLIINCFNAKGIKTGVNMGIVDIIERSKIKLIGLIEANNLIRDYQEASKTCYDIKNKRLRLCFDDIIGRILDDNIILKRKYKGIKRTDLYFKK
jgi:septum formation inhibitor-activating ATPase MinD